MLCFFQIGDKMIEIPLVEIITLIVVIFIIFIIYNIIKKAAK